MILNTFRKVILHSPIKCVSRVAYYCAQSKPLAYGRGKFSEEEQMDYIKSIWDQQNNNWTTVTQDILKISGKLNDKNIYGVLLRLLSSNRKFPAALTLAEHLKSQDMNLGTINGLLDLYYDLGCEEQLGEMERKFILDMYIHLYEKYKFLDATTCERLLHALCAIGEWKKGLKVLDDIFLSSKPSHSAYSSLIATMFKNNKKAEAKKLIEKSVCNLRPLKHIAYEEWINYIMRKYKDKKTIVKYLNEVLNHISENCIVITDLTAHKLKATFTQLGWNANFTRIRRQNGECQCCEQTLKCLKLSQDEFELLQNNVKEKVIVGTDVFLKSSPEELQLFLQFIDKFGPFDIVLDGLNIAFTSQRLGESSKNGKIDTLIHAVEYFSKTKQKILLLGRKHMRKWPKMPYLLSKTHSFFTDNLSQDDPYFITAAMLSGPNTDLVSKDLLRGHRFQFQNEKLRALFQKWQWQHQWKIFMHKDGKLNIQPPFSVTPCAQPSEAGWHLPYEREEPVAGRVRDGAPDWHRWLCIRQNG